MNGALAPLVMYCGSSPFHLPIASNCSTSGFLRSASARGRGSEGLNELARVGAFLDVVEVVFAGDTAARKGVAVTQELHTAQ